MKKKIFIVQYTDTSNSYPESFLFKIESTNLKLAKKLAYEEHNPNTDGEDFMDEEIKKDFYANIKLIATIDAPSKKVKLHKQ